MAKKKETYVIEASKDELQMILDGIDILSPDNDKASKLKVRLWDKVNLSPVKKPAEIIISVRGGVVTHVFSTDKTADVTVLDYDGDAADDNQKLWEKDILPRENKDLFTVC